MSKSRIIFGKSFSLHSRYLILLGILLLALGLKFFHDSRVETPKPAADVSVDSANLKVIYVPSKHRGRKSHFDGGKGKDTVKLILQPYEYKSPTFLADLIRFQYFLINNYNPKRMSGQGPIFSFKSFALMIRNVEVLEIQLLKTVGK